MIEWGILLAVGVILIVLWIANMLRGWLMGENWLIGIGWLDDLVFAIIVILYWVFFVIFYIQDLVSNIGAGSVQNVGYGVLLLLVFVIIILIVGAGATVTRRRRR